MEQGKSSMATQQKLAAPPNASRNGSNGNGKNGSGSEHAKPKSGASGKASGAASEADEISPYRWIILVGLVLAAILEVLDTTIVNVALPQMAGNLGATREEIGWVSTGYILSNVVVLPMTAWLAGRFGRKNYLAVSIVIFLIASFFCGVSGSLGALVFWRIVQGAGGAALLSTSQATIREIFPAEQQATVQAIYILGIVVAPTLGPTIGGWITDNYSWPWCFFVNLPIGAVCIGIVMAFLGDSKYHSARRAIDVPGILLLAVGLGSLQYVLEEGNQNDWFQDQWILRLTILSVVALISMVVWELSPRNKNPVVNFRVLKNRDLSAGIILLLALGFGLYGGVFIFPQFAQNLLGFSPTQTGLVLLPGGLGTAVSSMITGRLLGGKKQIISPLVMIVVGMALFVWSMWDLGHMTLASGEPDTKIALLIRGFGLGLLFSPINLAAFSSLKGQEIAQGSSLLNLARQLGGSFGIAVLSTYITKMSDFHRVNLQSNIYTGNPALMARQQAVAANLMHHGYSHTAAQQGAYGAIARTISAQALAMAYNNAFLLLGMSFVVVAPAILLLKPKKGGGAAAAAAGGH